MSKKTYLAIGAHIGDMDLTAGPVLTAAAMAGHRTALLALTPGERGHPRLSPEEYKEQKISEGRTFAEKIGAEFTVLEHSDGFLQPELEVHLRVADIIRDLKPDVVIAHWNESIHSDHRNASIIAEQARFYAGLPMDHELPRHGVSTFVYAENWEDQDDFRPDRYVSIPDEAFDAWYDAIQVHAFARGETYGFMYIDYYTSLMRAKGCLAGVQRACAFASKANPSVTDTL
ncbi:LmbE family N-acetylglucosaminyl deacetylase [Stackebrandtia albiflava]|uniref:LmbE family N-acetylglucosaminyl deacetylase n=1 Tax=Stackebrandtia albiflava TaxID=406432 RepID=A0A562VE39_9ACTN|nr:PIG-L family deacetylase [Stackebrandtia albiflava]TWJ16135.1 LmbE family N-acetylglucosaminyl deacetylase [Stackebrandtia albiflava]